MMDIGILGAGAIGSTLAHLIARSDLARRVRLVDEAGDVAAGKALDIMQAAPVQGFACAVSGSSDVTTLVGAAAIVLADDARGAAWDGDAGLVQLTRLTRIAAGRPIMCADAVHRVLVERGVRERGFRREHLFGTAPEALASALRALIALDVNGSPSNVTVLPLGVPPSHVVVPWEDATIGGVSAVRVLDEPVRRRIQATIPALWPVGPMALAAAAAKAVASVVGRSRGRVMAFVAPDDRLGRKARAAAWPVALGAEGITRVHVPALSAHDRTALDNATLL